MTSTERLKQYEDMFQKSQQYDPARYQQGFEKAYGEATNYNADLIGQRSEAIGQAQALPSQLREQYASSAIRNPLAQEALIATRRGNITSDISRLTDLLEARQSRYQDVLGKYLAGYQSDMQREQTAAENAWRLYQDALAQEEAEKARAAAAANAFDFSSLFGGGGGSEITGGGGPRVFEIPDDTRPQNLTNTVQDLLASGVTNYRNKQGAMPKYLELLKGSAISSLGGIPGITAYATSVAPDVWGDIKSGATNLWNKLVRR